VAKSATTKQSTNTNNPKYAFLIVLSSHPPDFRPF
jgi:hypothetical protein